MLRAGRGWTVLASLVLRAASAGAGGVRPERSVLFHTEQQPGLGQRGQRSPRGEGVAVLDPDLQSL